MDKKKRQKLLNLDQKPDPSNPQLSTDVSLKAAVEEHPINDLNGSDKEKVSKRLKKQEEAGKFENLKGLFDAPINRNIKWLHEKISRFNLADRRIQGLEAKIHVLFQEDEDTDFKNGESGEPGNKSFLDLLKEHDESGDGWEALKELEIKAVNQGINLSRLVLDLMFVNSVPLDDDMLVKFRCLSNSLKWVSEDESSVVIARFLDLIATTDSEIMKVKESNKEKIANEVMKEEAWFIKMRDKKEEEEAATVVEAESTSQEEGLMEDYTDKPILLLLKEILRLECFWMHRQVLYSKKSLKDAIPLLVAEIAECEEGLKVMENKVKELIKLYASWFGEEVLNMKESNLYKAMDLAINKLWNRIQEPEKEKGLKKD